MRALLLIVVSSLALLSACSEEVKTVDWWKEHSEERVAKVKECRNDPGRLATTPNCQNAEQADFVKWATKKDTSVLPVFTFDDKGNMYSNGKLIGEDGKPVE